MSSNPQPLIYFGKLPSRGDFVRSQHAPVLIQTLDRWLTGGVELLSADPRWKLLYDRATPTHFAFLGSRSPRGMAGHLIASADASGRRFPFITASLVDAEQPGELLARSPMVLMKAWQSFERQARDAHAAEDAEPLLHRLGEAEGAELPPMASLGRVWKDFLETQSVGSLEASLRSGGRPVSVRGLLLALGLLLQPVPASGVQRLDKGLRLPLPADPLDRPLVASFWLDLVSGFLSRADFELALFLPLREPAELFIGFDGASAQGLRALLDPEATAEVFIDLTDAEWVEEFVEQDYAVKKLASYLQQPGLSLDLARDTFREVFLGL